MKWRSYASRKFSKKQRRWSRWNSNRSQTTSFKGLEIQVPCAFSSRRLDVAFRSSVGGSMQLEVGDKVTVIRYIEIDDEPPIYTVVGFEGVFIKLKHPSIGGLFYKRMDSIDRVIKK